MFKLQKHSRLLTLLLLGTLLSPVHAQKSGQSGKVGPYTVNFLTRSHLLQVKKDYHISLYGNGSKTIQLNSTQYDLAALHIELILTGTKLKPTNFVATGQVKIVTRNADTGDKTIVTCDKAVYTATADPKDRGKIVMTGNVHSETLTKGFNGPITMNNGSSGVIEFLPNGDLSVDIFSDNGDGSISGQPIEPAPKENKKP